MPITIPLDRQSIRRNPQAGQTVFFQAGRVLPAEVVKVTQEDGLWVRRRYLRVEGHPDKQVAEESVKTAERPDGWIDSTTQPSQEMQEIHHVPSTWLFEYVPTQVTCEHCGWQGLHTELTYADKSDGEDEGWCDSDTVCPECGAWNCCDIDYEPVSFQEFEKLHPKT